MSSETTTVEPKFWTCDDAAEQLSATDIGEAVDQWADRCFPSPLPETVTVYGYAPMDLPSVERIADDVLDNLREWLDQEYGDQIDGDPTTIPPALKAAALTFAEAVRAHYPVWSCEVVTEQVVKVADYVDVADYQKCVDEAARYRRPTARSTSEAPAHAD